MSVGVSYICWLGIIYYLHGFSVVLIQLRVLNCNKSVLHYVLITIVFFSHRKTFTEVVSKWVCDCRFILLKYWFCINKYFIIMVVTTETVWLGYGWVNKPVSRNLYTAADSGHSKNQSWGADRTVNEGPPRNGKASLPPKCSSTSHDRWQKNALQLLGEITSPRTAEQKTTEATVLRQVRGRPQ